MTSPFVQRRLSSGVLAAPDPMAATFDYRPAGDATVQLVGDLSAICTQLTSSRPR